MKSNFSKNYLELQLSTGGTAPQIMTSSKKSSNQIGELLTMVVLLVASVYKYIGRALCDIQNA